jgi:hypothetical protein
MYQSIKESTKKDRLQLRKRSLNINVLLYSILQN